jgi:transcription-repair coupling factor (superfamily II helicase)
MMDVSAVIGEIRATREYAALIEAAAAQSREVKPLPLLATGLCDGAWYAFAAALAADARSLDRSKLARKTPPALIIMREERDITRLAAFLRGAGLRVRVYPVRDLNMYNIRASHETEHERLSVLGAIRSGGADIVLTVPDAALSYTMPRAKLEATTRTLATGDVVDLGELCGFLVGAGYARVDTVGGPGQFAVRGGIIDIFTPDASERAGDEDSVGVRVELYGDEIDRISLFDVGTQRALENVGTASITPAREVINDAEADVRIARAINSLLRTIPDAEKRMPLLRELESIRDKNLADADKYLPLVYPERECLLDYFERAVVIVRDEAGVRERAEASAKLADENVKAMLTEKLLPPSCAEYSARPSHRFETFLPSSVTVRVDTFARSSGSLGGFYDFRTRATAPADTLTTEVVDDIKTLSGGGVRVTLLLGTEPEAKEAAKALFDAGLTVALYNGGRVGDNDANPSGDAKPAEGGEKPADGAKSVDGAISPDDTQPAELRSFALSGPAPLSNASGYAHESAAAPVTIAFGSYPAGFEIVTSKWALLCPGPQGRRSAAAAARRRRKPKKNEQKIMSYADLVPGDYVIHENYGIGRYVGIQNLAVDGVYRDYIEIQYAGRDKLFLPVESLDAVSKYIGAGSAEGDVKLSKMGGADWTRAKSKAAAATREMARELIALYAERMRRPGFAFAPDDEMQREFESTFEFEETDAQLTACEDIKRDMERPVPMDRLLCGDVGYGKTEVALRAAFKAIMSGKQVALLCPTTILAFQHYGTACARMRGFPVTIDYISRFKTPAEQERTLRRLRRGEIDLLIGTHRLVSQDVVFKDLGLLIVDEEQRFGVAQKERLKQFAPGVDVLTLTATPIPRTLNMAMSGIRDMSVLDEAPENRLPVQTYVLEHDDAIINEAIRRELRRGGQVFYIYNRVEGITTIAARLKAAFPEARIAAAHGQMDRERLEDIWGSLVSGDTDILVSTTIIETGVDVPNANTLIIENADRLGLSQLHQIRGRVGRSARRAYAYFTYKRGKALSEIAEKRLEAIRDYAEFGAGFKIALRDLEIRGAGNLLGAEQHGILEAVGYDLYIKLLNEAVLEQKGETPSPKTECSVSFRADAFLPQSYVTTAGARMEMYKKIAHIECAEDAADVTDELCDRFGELPSEAEELIRVALARGIACRCGIVKLEEKNGELYIEPSKLDINAWSALFEEERKKAPLRVAAGATARIVRKLAKGERASDTAIRLLSRYEALTAKQ